MSPTKREIRRKFHLVVVQRQQRKVQKSVMHTQSYGLAIPSLLLFAAVCCA